MQINSMTFTEFLIANGDESLVEYIENYVLQALVNQFDVTPRYWSKNNPPYEVDFIIQRENDIIPVEVKAETNIQSKSLKKYKELFGDKIEIRVRFSLGNLKFDGDVLNIPLFTADYVIV